MREHTRSAAQERTILAAHALRVEMERTIVCPSCRAPVGEPCTAGRSRKPRSNHVHRSNAYNAVLLREDRVEQAREQQRLHDLAHAAEALVERVQ